MSNLYTYGYNNVIATHYDTFAGGVWLAFDTNPATLLLVDETDPSIILQTVVLNSGYNVSGMVSLNGSGTNFFINPRGVCVDTVHNKIFITDDNLEKVISFDSGSGGTIFGQHIHTFSGFNRLKGICVDSVNNKLYAVEFNGPNRIWRFDSGTNGTTLGGNVENFGSTGSGVNQFSVCFDIAFDSTNHKLYVTDEGNNRIACFDSGEGATILGNNWQTFYHNASGEIAFNHPFCVCLDILNNKVYISDYNNNRICRFDSQSGTTTLGDNWEEFGIGGSGSGQFSGPNGITFDGINNKIYIADTFNNRIVRIDSGSGATTFGNNWESFGSGIGSGVNQFHYPDGIFVDSINNKIYVTDYDNARIARFDSTSGGTTFGNNWETLGPTIGGGNKLCIICNISPGKMVILHTDTLEQVEVILKHPYPISILNDGDVGAVNVLIGTNENPAHIEYWDVGLSDGTFDSDYTLDGGQCKAIAFDNETFGFCGTLYTTGLTARIWRWNYPDISYIDIPSINKLITCDASFESSDSIIWVGNNENPSKIAKINLTTNTYSICTLPDGNNNLAGLIVVNDSNAPAGYKALAIFPTVGRILKISESGGIFAAIMQNINLNSDNSSQYDIGFNASDDKFWVGLRTIPGKVFASFLNDTWTVLNLTTKKVITDFRWSNGIVKQIFTNLHWITQTIKTVVTDFRFGIINPFTVKTDLRFSPTNYDVIEPKPLDNGKVIKDGTTELTDVDLTTIKLTFNLGKTPSRVEFNIARRFDKPNHMMDGTVSTLQSENKIQIYDDTILLFTGYITQLKGNSSNDTVTVVAEDKRYKLVKTTMQLEWGAEIVLAGKRRNSINQYSIAGDYIIASGSGVLYGVSYDNGDYLIYNMNSITRVPGGIYTTKTEYQPGTNAAYTIFKVSIPTNIALQNAFAAISSLISGYDTIDFGYTPEYTREYNDCATLIDTLLQNSANINWYIDENEYIRFQKVGKGTHKALPVSGLTVQRHIYDVVLSDVVLQRQRDTYYSSFQVILGQAYTQRWSQSIQYPDLSNLPSRYVRELTWFAFQHAMGGAPIPTPDGPKNLIYCGENLPSIATSISENVYWQGYFIYQWLQTDMYSSIAPVIIGTGAPVKTVYMTSYGSKFANEKYEEKTLDDGTTWLYRVKEENFDRTAFAIDSAKFDLSQNNALLTEATATLILDAYEYYGISFKDLLSFSNTTIPNIYNDMNGFPINISSISIDFATRLVTMSLTNYGKTWYQKIGNYNGVYLSPYQIQYLKKYNQFVFKQNV